MPTEYRKAMRDTMDTRALVIGSGSAGATATIAAAQAGTVVTLAGHYGLTGGISTQVLDTFYGFYTPGKTAHKVIGGIPDEATGELFARNKALLRPNTYGAGQGITYDPETLKLIWETLAVQAGVQLLYHTFVIDVLKDHERVTGVIAASKGGLLALRADVIIDASSDADMACAAGVPFESAASGVQL